MNQNDNGHQLHFLSLYLLIQVFRRSSNHESADKDCQNHIHYHVHQAYALAAEHTV